MNNIKKSIKYILSGLIFVIPFFFLPWPGIELGMDNFNKSYLLLIVIPILLFLFIYYSLKDNKIEIKKPPFLIPVIIFLVACIIAVVLSKDIFTSFFGGLGFVSFPLLILLINVIFYIFINSYADKENKVASLLRTQLYSYSFLIISVFLIIFGLWIGLLDDGSALIKTFTKATGSIEDLAVYMAVMNVFIFALLVFPEINKHLFNAILNKWLIKLILIFSLWVMMLTNFVSAWWCLLIGVIVIICGRFWWGYFSSTRHAAKNHEVNVWQRVKKNSGTITMFLLPLIMLLVNYQSFDQTLINRRMARELKLDYANSLTIVKSVVAENGISGYGQDNFHLAFSQFRDPALNNTSIWSYRFIRSSSFVMELFVSTGFIGLLSYFVLLIFVLRYIGRLLLSHLKNKNKKTYDLSVIISAVIISLMAGQFIYSLNIVLLFLFWFFLALLPFNYTEKRIASALIIKKNRSALFLVFTFIILAFFFVWIGLLTQVAKNWAADAYFAQGKNSIDKLMQAVRLNPKRYNYQIALAKRHKDKALGIISPNASETDLAQAGKDINQAIDWAQQAIRTAPEAVSAYETQAMIYRDIAPFSANSYLLAARSFRQAIAFEPTNPVLYLELGKVLLNSQDPAEAIIALEKAVSLKANFKDAEFNLARAYIINNQANKALAILSVLASEDPSIEVLFEQGKAYYQLKNYGKASASFNQVILRDPLNANALFSLGLALEAAGETDEALYYFKKVQALNPDNIEVKEKIKDLENIE